MSAVLVIGGTGGLGRAVTAGFVADGHRVLTLARSGASVTGDVTRPLLGLPASFLSGPAATVTTVVWAAGQVDWSIGPKAGVHLHQLGTQNLGQLLPRLPALRRVVYVSSILALGRAQGPVSSEELHRDQTFRNWYEFGKYLGEQEARRLGDDFDVRILRFGPLIGPERPDTATGLGALIPFLRLGLPAHLVDRGEFPAYGGALADAARAVVAAAEIDDFPAVSTWVDPALPSLARLIRAVCSWFAVEPKLVDLPVLERVVSLIQPRRLGLPPELLAYSRPLPELDLRAEEAFVRRTGLSLMATPTAHYLGEVDRPGPAAGLWSADTGVTALVTAPRAVS